MKVLQKEITLPSHKRGFHLITTFIEDEFTTLTSSESIGLLNILIKHTSASLSINENSSPDVRTDFNTFFNKLVPENENFYTHTEEGSDDMPAHLKTALLDTFLQLPVKNGKLNLGTWQGIYLCEHRNSPHKRKLVLTYLGT